MEERDPRFLDVTLAVLDPGIPERESEVRAAGIFPEIRAVEASYLPFVLRRLMVASSEWGVVRVVPEADPTAELQVYGTILESNGVTLTLAIRAVDSTGREWLNRTFSETSLNYSSRFVEPFTNLYQQIASALVKVRRSLTEKQLLSIIEISALRYAAQLVPEAYASYLEEQPDGSLRVRRLPSRDDPLMARIDRVREFENLFTDTIDEEFRLLQDEIAATYSLWCRYRRQVTEYEQDEEQRARNRKTTAPRGSFEAMRRHYDNFKWSKLQEQQLSQWAEGFNNEVDATVVEVEGRVVELTGDLNSRYEEWRRILRSIFEIENQTP